MYQKISSFLIVFTTFLLASPFAFAHVTVKPSQVSVAVYQTFTMGVPSEKELATISLRLVIPDGVESIMPTVKPGWDINLKKEGDKVTEITWSGGQIPSEQRDEFSFSAQAPANESTLVWKAYQTYADGTVISWDQSPEQEVSGEDSKTPYSQTKVVNDLAATPTPAVSTGNKALMATTLSVLALIFSAIALGLQIRKKR
jgi:uncharacterized protein YcnI